MMQILITAVFLLAALWHRAASFYFLARAGRMLGAHTFDRPVAPIAVDRMQFLWRHQSALRGRVADWCDGAACLADAAFADGLVRNLLLFAK